MLISLQKCWKERLHLPCRHLMQLNSPVLSRRTQGVAVQAQQIVVFPLCDWHARCLQHVPSNSGEEL